MVYSHVDGGNETLHYAIILFTGEKSIAESKITTASSDEKLLGLTESFDGNGTVTGFWLWYERNEETYFRRYERSSNSFTPEKDINSLLTLPMKASYPNSISFTQMLNHYVITFAYHPPSGAARYVIIYNKAFNFSDQGLTSSSLDSDSVAGFYYMDPCDYSSIYVYTKRINNTLDNEIAVFFTYNGSEVFAVRTVLLEDGFYAQTNLKYASTPGLATGHQISTGVITSEVCDYDAAMIVVYEYDERIDGHPKGIYHSRFELPIKWVPIDLPMEFPIDMYSTTIALNAISWGIMTPLGLLILCCLLVVATLMGVIICVLIFKKSGGGGNNGGGNEGKENVNDSDNGDKQLKEFK